MTEQTPAKAEERAEHLKERIYVTFTALAVVIALGWLGYTVVFFQFSAVAGLVTLIFGEFVRVALGIVPGLGGATGRFLAPPSVAGVPLTAAAVHVKVVPPKLSWKPLPVDLPGLSCTNV